MFNPKNNVLIDGSMAFTLVAAVVAFTMLYVYLVLERFQLAQLEEGREERELELAIAERVRAETDGGRSRMSHNWSFVDRGLLDHRGRARRATSCGSSRRSRQLRRTFRDENRD